VAAEEARIEQTETSAAAASSGGEGKKLHYPVSEAAARYGASTPEETDTPREAYRDWSRDFTPVRATWPL